ncbi:MAG: matrixin family metalloprotease [Armatimonadota bacterium]
MRLSASATVPLVLLLVAAWGCGSGDGARSYSLHDGAESNSLPEASERDEAALPIGWRIGEIDPRFGLTEDEVRNAVERAVGLWEGAVGRDLFAHDPARGIPINLEYDHRQERRMERQRARADLDGLLERLQDAKARLRSAEQEVEMKAADLRRRQDALNEATRRHNQRVREWNLRGGAPPDIVQEVNAERRSIERRQSALDLEESSLRALQLQAERYVQEHNALVEEYNALVNRYNEQFGEGWQEEAGRYESMGGRSGFKSITVFVVEDLDHLALVLAHELGHALGIEHVEHDPSALMSPYVPHEGDDGYVLRLTEADIAALNATLPAR